MIEIRGLTVSVGYGPLLAITLPRNLRYLSECVVVTSHDDIETASIVESIDRARLLKTDAFTRYDAMFNKGLAIEEGFDFLGRNDWILILDADILLPNRFSLPDNLRPDVLYGASRRILKDPAQWHEDLNWQHCPRWRDGGPIGFFQLFHADAISDKRPWYDVTFSHAGGGDAYFLTHWSASHRRVLPIDCLHLGPVDRHWFGTSEEAKRTMDAFVIRNGWKRAAMGRDQVEAAKVPPIKDRVEVPGYKSDFELPFVRRAKLQTR